MKWYLVFKLLAKVVDQIDADDIEQYFDAGLDILEVKYADNPLVIQTLKLVRQVASIEDND